MWSTAAPGSKLLKGPNPSCSSSFLSTLPLPRHSTREQWNRGCSISSSPPSCSSWGRWCCSKCFSFATCWRSAPGAIVILFSFGLRRHHALYDFYSLVSHPSVTYPLSFPSVFHAQAPTSCLTSDCSTCSVRLGLLLGVGALSVCNRLHSCCTVVVLQAEVS